MDRVIRDVGMANATIDWIYRDIEDQSHATCEEMFTGIEAGS